MPFALIKKLDLQGSFGLNISTFPNAYVCDNLKIYKALQEIAHDLGRDDC